MRIETPAGALTLGASQGRRLARRIGELWPMPLVDLASNARIQADFGLMMRRGDHEVWCVQYELPAEDPATAGESLHALGLGLAASLARLAGQRLPGLLFPCASYRRLPEDGRVRAGIAVFASDALGEPAATGGGLARTLIEHLESSAELGALPPFECHERRPRSAVGHVRFDAALVDGEPIVLRDIEDNDYARAEAAELLHMWAAAGVKHLAWARLAPVRDKKTSRSSTPAAARADAAAAPEQAAAPSKTPSRAELRKLTRETTMVQAMSRAQAEAARAAAERLASGAHRAETAEQEGTSEDATEDGALDTYSMTARRPAAATAALSGGRSTQRIPQRPATERDVSGEDGASAVDAPVHKQARAHAKTMHAAPELTDEARPPAAASPTPAARSTPGSGADAGAVGRPRRRGTQRIPAPVGQAAAADLHAVQPGSVARDGGRHATEAMVPQPARSGGPAAAEDALQALEGNPFLRLARVDGDRLHGAVLAAAADALVQARERAELPVWLSLSTPEHRLEQDRLGCDAVVMSGGLARAAVQFALHADLDGPELVSRAASLGPACEQRTIVTLFERRPSQLAPGWQDVRFDEALQVVEAAMPHSPHASFFGLYVELGRHLIALRDGFLVDAASDATAWRAPLARLGLLAPFERWLYVDLLQRTIDTGYLPRWEHVTAAMRHQRQPPRDRTLSAVVQRDGDGRFAEIAVVDPQSTHAYGVRGQDGSVSLFASAFDPGRHVFERTLRAGRRNAMLQAVASALRLERLHFGGAPADDFRSVTLAGFDLWSAADRAASAVVMGQTCAWLGRSVQGGMMVAGAGQGAAFAG
jgi:hypothetical protein